MEVGAVTQQYSGGDQCSEEKHLCQLKTEHRKLRRSLCSMACNFARCSAKRCHATEQHNKTSRPNADHAKSPMPSRLTRSDQYDLSEQYYKPRSHNDAVDMKERR